MVEILCKFKREKDKPIDLFQNFAFLLGLL